MNDFQVDPKVSDFDRKFRECIASAMTLCGKNRGLSRAQIAEELEKRVGRRIPLSVLNDFASPSHTSTRFPAAWIPVFCDITGDDQPQRLMLSEELRARLKVGETVTAMVGEELAIVLAQRQKKGNPKV